jgi:hypothetical protein
MTRRPRLPSLATDERVRLEGRVTDVAIADDVAHFTTDARGVWRFRMEVTP